MYIIYGACLFLSLAFAQPQSVCDPDDLKCLLEHDSRDVISVSARPYTNATLPCNAFSAGKVLKTEWYSARRSKLVGVWMSSDQHGNSNAFSVGEDSSLFISAVNRDLVEEYECLVHYNDGHNASSFVLLRLDFSFFYKGPVFSTVFWGSCMTSLIFCVSSFILNVLWIIVRKVSMWWINRAERLNRVRAMLEAMEKYKSRQMEVLHENYHKKVNAIRENYNNQVSDIRTSYSRQAERFRDYKQAQFEQLNRIKDFGTRRADQLVESYERQLNKMRTFTLQHRLKLMRQYKLKQHQLNKLLENIAKNENHASIHENKDIHEMLNLQNPALQKSEFSRSASFYSLPDLTSDEFAHHTNHSFPLIDFKQFRHSVIEKESNPIANKDIISQINEIDSEQQTSSNTPLLKHHRRKSSNLRQVSSFSDCREQQ